LKDFFRLEFKNGLANTWGGNIAESCLPKNFVDIGKFGDIGPPFVLGAYIAGSFLPNCEGFRQKITVISAILGKRYCPPL
jgi:hypothetical protein